MNFPNSKHDNKKQFIMAMLGQKCSTFHRIFLTVCRKEKKTYQYQVNLICNQIIILRTVPVLHYFYSVKMTFQKYILIVCIVNVYRYIVGKGQTYASELLHSIILLSFECTWVYCVKYSRITEGLQIRRFHDWAAFSLSRSEPDVHQVWPRVLRGLSAACAVQPGPAHLPHVQGAHHQGWLTLIT